MAASDDEAAAEAEKDSAAAVARPAPVELTPEEPEDIRMDWYILKVQSNRERSIAEALERKMRIEGLRSLLRPGDCSHGKGDGV